MDLILHGWEILLSVDNFGSLNSLQIGKLHFVGEMVTDRTGLHPRNLPAARKAANKSLRRLKDRGYIDVLPVAGYLDPGEFRSLRTDERVHLTEEGSKALANHMNIGKAPGRPRYRTRWKRGIRQELLDRYNDDKHDVLAIEVVTNLVGSMRTHAGVPQIVLPNTQFSDLIRSGETLLQNVEPDGLILVQFPTGPRAFLIEVDTGTQDLGIIAEKARKYGDYFTSRFGKDEFFFGYQQPQVLFVTGLKGKRAEHIKVTIAETGGRRAYAVSTLEWISPPKFDACGAVWFVPTKDGYSSLQIEG